MTPSELLALRKRLMLNQRQMAEELGIKLRMYCYLEKGEYPISATVAKLAALIAEHR